MKLIVILVGKCSAQLDAYRQRYSRAGIEALAEQGASIVWESI